MEWDVMHNSTELVPVGIDGYHTDDVSVYL